VNDDISLSKVRFTGVAPYHNYPINLKLPYRFNHLTFFYSAIDWSAPHKIQYQYKLEGSDQDWRQITKETKAIYTNLTHGDYTFKVKAIGAWSDTFEYSFTILPPWWLTWWAYMIYGITILLLIYAWRRYDLKRQHLKHDLELEHVQTEKLEELDKMKSRFFANISHEFRTPLTLILGPLQNLISKASDKDSKQELDIMQRNARRLQKLINQLLNLSRIEAGKMKLQAREENIISLARLFVQSFESYAAQRKISLVFTAKEEQIPVYVDRDKIEKILSNLLSNAFKFTGEGGRIEVAVGSPQSAVGSPQSAVGSKATEDWRLKTGDYFNTGVNISISDTGSGIPPKRLKHIFDRFYQADDTYSKDQEGSGIGLALTKELVEIHYGEIKVVSEPGKGTTFNILLPLGKSHLKPKEIIKIKKSDDNKFIPELADPLVPIIEEQPVSIASPNDTLENSTPILLIVEDNADLRAYIRGFLDKNYHVIEAEDGESGFDKALKTIPDLIISDVMMPRMDGYELCRHLKTDERTDHIPIILLTARAAMESKIEGMETGADDFITKPFEPEELKARIKNLIEQRNKLKERYRKELNIESTLTEDNLLSRDKRFLDKAQKTVQKYMIEPDFTVEDFAKEMAMSRVQLHRKLRALINQTASEFIRILRVIHAAKLLIQQDANISEVAYDVGFNSPSSFTRSFTKHFGMPPTEYINKNSNK